MLLSLLIAQFPEGAMRDAANHLRTTLDGNPASMALLKTHFSTLAIHARVARTAGTPLAAAFATWLEEYAALPIGPDVRVAVQDFLNTVIGSSGEFNAHVAPRLMKFLR